MKKIVLIVVLSLVVGIGSAQTKTAAIGFLYAIKPQVTFYGNPNAVNYSNQYFYFTYGQTHDYPVLFTDITYAVKYVLPKLGFRLVPEDSIITTDDYKALVVKNTQPKGYTTDILAKGYAYHTNLPELFSKTHPNPDVMIEAYADFELNFVDANQAYLVYNMTIVGYNEKKKKVFSFKTKAQKGDKRIKVLVKPSSTSGWGYEIAEDISQKQADCITFSYSQLDELLPEQIEKVTKFYAK